MCVFFAVSSDSFSDEQHKVRDHAMDFTSGWSGSAVVIGAAKLFRFENCLSHLVYIIGSAHTLWNVRGE